MDPIYYVKKLFNWIQPKELKSTNCTKRRANFDDDFSGFSSPKLRRLSSGMETSNVSRERIIPIKLCDPISSYRYQKFNPNMASSRARVDTRPKEFVEISDDDEEDPVHLVDDIEQHPTSFYSRREPSRSYHQPNGVDDDDDDDVLYVTCSESNESKAKRLGYKLYKSRLSYSPVVSTDSLFYRKRELPAGQRSLYLHNRVTKPTSKRNKLFTTQSESVRLDDKRKYEELLKKFSPKFGTSKNFKFNPSSDDKKSDLLSSFSIYKTPTDSRSRSRKMLDSVLQLDDEDDVVDLTRQNGIGPAKQSFDLFKSNINYKSSPVINNVSATNGDLTKNCKPKKVEDQKETISCDISSKDSDSEVEIVSPGESVKTQPSEPKSISSCSKSTSSLRAAFESKPICKLKWIEDLRTKYDNANREKQQKIQEEKLRKERYSEHNRKIFGALLEDRIRRSLIISDPIEIIDSADESEPFPEFTPEQESLINRALSPNPPSEVLARNFNMSITRRDIHSLAGLNWLNDEVINFYMNLIMERSKQENKPKVYATNTFFYPKLMSGGQQSLRRWTKKVDIFAHDIMLIPVHLDVHWCMALIDFRDKTIRYYDSMGSHNTRCVEALLQYLVEEKMDKKKEKFDKTGWSMPPAKNIPQQMNGSDCGMFSCTFAEFYSRNAKFTFSQENMPYLRRKMVLEILLGKLLIN